MLQNLGAEYKVESLVGKFHFCSVSLMTLYLRVGDAWRGQIQCNNVIKSLCHQKRKMSIPRSYV